MLDEDSIIDYVEEPVETIRNDMPCSNSKFARYTEDTYSRAHAERINLSDIPYPKPIAARATALSSVNRMGVSPVGPCASLEHSMELTSPKSTDMSVVATQQTTDMEVSASLPQLSAIDEYFYFRFVNDTAIMRCSRKTGKCENMAADAIDVAPQEVIEMCPIKILFDKLVQVSSYGYTSGVCLDSAKYKGIAVISVRVDNDMFYVQPFNGVNYDHGQIIRAIVAKRDPLNHSDHIGQTAQQSTQAPQHPYLAQLMQPCDLPKPPLCTDDVLVKLLNGRAADTTHMAQTSFARDDVYPSRYAYQAPHRTMHKAPQMNPQREKFLNTMQTYYPIGMKDPAIFYYLLKQDESLHYELMALVHESLAASNRTPMPYKSVIKLPQFSDYVDPNVKYDYMKNPEDNM